MTGLLPFIETALRRADRPEPAGTGRRRPSAVAGTGPPRPEHLQPLDHRRLDRRGGRRERSAPAACWSASAPTSTTSARCSSRATSSRTRRPDDNRHETLVPGHEHAGDHRPHQGRRRPGPAAPPAASRSSTSSSSITARRWSSTSTAGPTSRARPTPTAARSTRAPSAIPAPSRRPRKPAVLMLADAVESASRTLVEPDPGADRKPGPRDRRAAAARRPVRRERPDAPRAPRRSRTAWSSR